MIDSSKPQRTLDLEISDPVSMLNEIARRYESTERILMEYVDNALDDAEMLYRENGMSYPYPIRIEVIIDFEARAITVRDNCRGMTKETLERIVRNVGESQKRGVTWVNGRFGFGVQAFRAATEVIRFQTNPQNGPHLVLELHRDQHRGISEARSSVETFPSDTGTGTMVTIGGFEDEWFESITVDSVRQEIESHFERLLARPRLRITVSEAGQESVRCQAFRYRAVPGQAIKRVLNLKYKKQTFPVEVHLKIADVEVPGRTVRFFARGRRINYVTEIKSFIRKSDYRTSVWGHPNLLGYIEVGELVRPVITRDDFVRNKGRQILYEAILGLEERIKAALDRVNEAHRDTTLNLLEDVLGEVLDTIARQDRRQFRLQIAARRRSKPAQSRKPAAPGENGASPPDDQVPAQTTPAPPAEQSDFEQRTTHHPQAAPAPSLSPDDDIEISQSSDQDQTPQAARRRRRGFGIQFFDIPPDAEGQIKRSYLVDNTIYINVAHPDFQERMVYTRQGQPKMTDRLSSYIAATISIHYKDQFYTQYGHAPEGFASMFDDQVDFIFRLESALREHLPAIERELSRQRLPEEAAA